MNIILFTAPEVQLPLPAQDPRTRHILKVLRRQPGDTFDVGLINGPRGKATLDRVREDGALVLSFSWGVHPAPPAPIHLVVGLPRPQTARDILREATALGVTAMDFVPTERGEPSYASSSLWRSREWEAHLIAGASQAFTTHLPQVRHGLTLAEVACSLRPGDVRIGLDNYEAGQALGQADIPRDARVILAVGSERGWTDRERQLLRENGFQMVHLGERVLRTETACLAAIAIVKAKLGLS